MNSDTQKQFVIQEHTTPSGVHWDLMLETEDTLWTWRLNTPPAEIKNEALGAERIGDHPLRFLTYEGPVQNSTGQVTIADKGTCSLREQIENSLLINMQGEMLKGEFILCKPKDSPLWRLQGRD
jgi:hypothetical protein